MKLLEFGNRYARQSSWKDFALTKLCLFSMGLFVGSLFAGKWRDLMRKLALIGFVISYIPLLIQMIRVFRHKD